MPTQTSAYSEWSKKRIATPPATTTIAVAVTITLAAVRTEGGRRRKLFIRRSTRFGRPTLRPPRVRGGLLNPSEAVLDLDPAGVGRGLQPLVVALGLSGVDLGEGGERAVEDVARPEVARDGDGVAGAGVG